MVGSLPDVITYAKLQVESFRGYDIRGDRISHFPSDFCTGLTTVQRYCAACDFAVWRITDCTVVQNCCKGRSKSIGNGTFGGAAMEKPLNRLTQNLAWVIRSGTPLSSPNGMSIGSGGVTPTKG